MMTKRVFLSLILIFLLMAGACQRAEEKKPNVLVEPKWKITQSQGARSVEAERSLSSLQVAFVKIAEKVVPAVVNISSQSPSQGEQSGLEPFKGEPSFRDFLEDLFRRRSERRQPNSLGSGIVMNPEGFILTNYHVIRDAEDINVKLSNNARYKARVIGSDSGSDLAVIKVEPSGPLPFAPFGDSDRLQVGQWAIAIGNPFGLDRTLTVGVVSAKGRSRVGAALHQELIQTDASINPGNSGGPLLNIEGEVIGVNTAMLAWGHGIGFAIPINAAKKITAELIEKGKVIRPWMGVGIEALTPEMVSSLGVNKNGGVLVSRVFANSPAAAAGLMAGDVISKFEGQKLQGTEHLQQLVAKTSVGQSAELDLTRAGKELRLKIKLGERPEEPRALAQAAPEEKADRLGVKVRDLPPGVARRLKLEAGVAVIDLVPGSQGARAGLLPGDIILAVNGKKVNASDQYYSLMSSLKPGSSVAFRLNRQDIKVDLAFQMQK